MTSTEDLGYQAHLAAVARIEALHAAEFEDGPEVEEAFAPYCGCLDCMVREALDAAWPFMAQLAITEHEQTIKAAVEKLDGLNG